MNKNQLPYGLRPYEIGYLILLAVAYYYTDVKFRGSPQPLLWFGAALVGGVAVLAARCREEFLQLPNKLFFFGLLAAWAALFAAWGNSTLGYVHSSSLFVWLFDIYTATNADAEHGLMIPFIVLALFWWKRRRLLARPAALWWPGVFLVVAALFLHVVAYAVQIPSLSAVAFFAGIYALTGLAWGRHWLKESLFPYFLLGFCVPVGGALDGFTFKLRLIVSWAVEHLAHLGLAPDLIRQGTQLFDAQRTFAYEVAAACSGIRSLMALLALMMVYGFVALKSPWRRAVMALAALPLAVLGNVARLCVTIGVAETFGQEAGKAVETNFGFVTFAVAFGSAYLLARWLEKNEAAAAAKAPAIAS
ncbi:MAG: exosortase/archaeosortase family protein [Verrucomicrobiota bacterium]